MIVQEHFRVKETPFIRTDSDSGVKVRGGSPEADYNIAEDPAECGRIYTETDIPIDEPYVAEILDIILGGSK